MAIVKAENCVSCGIGLVAKGSAQMPCPRCGTTIGRCGGCREQSVAYTCSSCEFQGP